MNLRQLRTLCEIVDRGLRVTDAAHATYRSQSSVTRQMQLLEDELGVELFARKGNRLLRMTPHAEQIVEVARRMLRDAENIYRIGRNAAQDERGTFTIATTNFQAKYVLPRTVRQFVERYPDVSLSLRQGTPPECCELVAAGKTDMAVCTEVPLPDGLVALPCYRLYRSILTPPRHPLLRIRPLTLEALCRYPLITYDESFSGASIVNRTFSDHGLQPKIVVSVVDADVSKIYVGMGLGIAIAASVAFNARQDANLRRLDAHHLFEPSDASIVLRRQTHLRGFMFDFMKMFAPKLDRSFIENVLFGKNPAPSARAELPEL
jgi:LysR family cys regulon transcriptional activator